MNLKRYAMWRKLSITPYRLQLIQIRSQATLILLQLCLHFPYHQVINKFCRLCFPRPFSSLRLRLLCSSCSPTLHARTYVGAPAVVSSIISQFLFPSSQLIPCLYIYMFIYFKHIFHMFVVLQVTFTLEFF